MSIRNRLGRQWRSVSFRAGLWSALLMALIGVAASAVYSLALASSALTESVSGINHVSILDQIETQIMADVLPDDLVVREYLADSVTNREEELTWMFWAVLDGDVVVGSGGRVWSDVLEGPFSDPLFASVERAFPRTVRRVVGTDWYVVERDITTNEGQRLRTVAAIEDLTDLREQIKIDLRYNARFVLISMLGAMVITSFYTRRALRRVETMRLAVEAISDESLDQRIPIADAADGIDKLATTMNDMLDRLERSADQQNQFLADASHELRSPVAGLVAQLEVAAAYPDRVDHDVLLPKLGIEAERLHSLVNDLLFLSRSEAGESSGLASEAEKRTPIDDIIDAEVEHQKLVGAEVEVAVASRSGEALAGNRRNIERAIRNLVDNAVRHANATVWIGSRRDGNDVVISVVDDGAGVPDEEADRIFDRFVRLDEARSRDAGGAGLGLAITREIARSHGGDVHLIDSATGAQFDMRLPATIACTPNARISEP